MKTGLIATLSVIAAAFLMPTGTAVAADTEAVAASANISRTEEITMINELVHKAATKGFEINPADYEVRMDESGDAIVLPKGKVVDISKTKDKTGGSVKVTATSAPDPAGRQVDGDPMAIQQEPVWQEPDCYGRVEDDENVGYMDATCSAWGEMNYAAATRDNWVVRFSSSCGATGEGGSWAAVFVCRVATQTRTGDGPPLVWNERQPMSAKNLDQCETIPLEITAGPVTAGYTIHTCEKLVPILFEQPGMHFVDWKGLSNELDEVRETGLLVGVGVERGQLPVLHLTWSYGYCQDMTSPRCFA